MEWSLNDDHVEDGSPVPLCYEALFGWVKKTFVADPDKQRAYGTDTVFEIGVLDFDFTTEELHGSASEEVPPEYAEQAAALWRSADTASEPAELDQFLTAEREVASAAITHSGRSSVDDAVEVAALPVVFIPEREGTGWFVAGLTTNPIPLNDAHDDEVYDRDRPLRTFLNNDDGGLMAWMFGLLFGDDDDSGLMALLSNLIHSNNTDDDVEDDEEEDGVVAVLGVTNMVCDLMPPLTDSIRRVENGDTTSLAGLSTLLGETADRLYDHHADDIAEHLDDVSDTFELVEEHVVGVGCDVDTEIRRRCEERLIDAVVYVLAWLSRVTADMTATDVKSQTSGGQAKVNAATCNALTTTLKLMASTDLPNAADSDRHKWLRTGKYLLRVLKRAKPAGQQMVLPDPQRTLKLCRQLCEQSYPALLGIDCPPLLFGVTDLETLALDGWNHVGGYQWQLGANDDEMPRLRAIAGNEHPAMILLPPIGGPAVASYDPAEFIEALRQRNHDPVVTTLGDSYSTCSGCGCPLMPMNGEQTCPSCRQRLATMDLSEQVRELATVVVYANTEAELARTAADMTDAFNDWLCSLQVRHKTTESLP